MIKTTFIGKTDKRPNNKNIHQIMLRVDKDVFWFCTVKSDIRDIDKSEFNER